MAPGRPKWVRLYYVLAAFDLFAVCLGLYVTHSLMEIYSRSVQVNQEWAERGYSYSRLAELAAAVEAPATDVFNSHDPEGESHRMWRAKWIFDSQLEEMRGELRSQVAPDEAEPLIARLDAVGKSVSAIAKETQVVLSYLRDGRPQRAAERMATVDDRYADVTHAVSELHEDIARMQRETFERQAKDARRLQRYEILIGVLILLMVLAAALYGRRMARHVARQTLERERALTAMAHARAGLQEANQGLEALFRRTLDVQEHERHYIARELHEDVAQLLAALRLRLGSADAGKRARADMRDAGTMAESALHRLQDLVSGLAPHGMEIVGLGAVLSDQLPEWTRDSGLVVEFDHRTTGRPSYEVQTAAYRIVEEAVRNAARHSAAKTLRVEVLQTDKGLEVHVADDGVGFSVANGMLGIGLMKLRALLAGGELAITSSPGRGTAVTAIFPATAAGCAAPG
jgi:signal transduction histidine kinase